MLLQAFISQLKLEGFALMADMVYVTQVRAELCHLERGPEQFTPVCASWTKWAEPLVRVWETLRFVSPGWLIG